MFKVFKARPVFFHALLLIFIQLIKCSYSVFNIFYAALNFTENTLRAVVFHYITASNINITGGTKLSMLFFPAAVTVSKYNRSLIIHTCIHNTGTYRYCSCCTISRRFFIRIRSTGSRKAVINYAHIGISSYISGRCCNISRFAKSYIGTIILIGNNNCCPGFKFIAQYLRYISLTTITRAAGAKSLFNIGCYICYNLVIFYGIFKSVRVYCINQLCLNFTHAKFIIGSNCIFVY